MVYNWLDGGTVNDVRICAAGDKDVPHEIRKGCQSSHVISVQRRRSLMDIIRNPFTGCYHHRSKCCNFSYPRHSDMLLFLLCQKK